MLANPQNRESHQQRQLKQQNQATLAALQQNAVNNQQQLAALQQNVAQLQLQMQVQHLQVEQDQTQIIQVVKVIICIQKQVVVLTSTY